MSPAARAAIQTTIDGYAAALAADSINPQPTATLNGKTVDRSTWRAGMTALIQELRDLDNAEDLVYSRQCRHAPPF